MLSFYLIADVAIAIGDSRSAAGTLHRHLSSIF
jgi:hypothetical protein